MNSSAEESGDKRVASLPRPKHAAAGCGLGNAAICWKTHLSTADLDCLTTQGGAARLRRAALPWATLFNAFGVEDGETCNFKTYASGYDGRSGSD